MILIFGGLALLGGLYASQGAISSVWLLAEAGIDYFYPNTEKPETASAPGGQAPLSGIAAKFSNSLMTMEDGTPRALDASRLAGVKYWAFYYSASWCPPCRAFTPDLVSFYRDFKPSHPDFELIFVNYDRSEDDMLNYMRSDAMPWPAVWYADIDNPDLDARKYCGNGIPSLVLVDEKGNVLSTVNTFMGYRDPHEVIADIRSMVK